MRNGQNRLDAKNDLSAQGAHVSAGNTVALNADGKINLQAAQNTASQTSSNSSSSGSIGISFGIGGANSGLAVTASASKARGNADGNDVTWINTQVSAGNQVTLNSGGDTTIKGAVVAANQVTAKVGGNFAIESPQDTSQYTSQQKSVGGSITAGFDGKVSGSINASKSNIKSDFASVGEQSGIKAGDAGFKVDIANNADLKGGAITSTDKAVQDGKNTFKQGGILSTSDIQNKADYSASSVGANFGTGFDPAGKLTPQGTSAGIGIDTAASTTKAGISGIAGNKDARTTDAQTGIAKIFDASKVQKDIDAQTQITQRFGLEASKAIGDYAATQLQTAKTLRDQAAKESDPTKAQALKSQAQALEKNWGEQGTLRVLAHTAVGGLTGGVSGAAGAAAAASAAPLLADLQENIQTALSKAGASPTVAKGAGQLISGLTASGIGAAVGGAAGAATGLNSEFNNRQLHQSEIQWIKANAARYAQQKGISQGDAEKQLASQAYRQVQFGAQGGAAAWDAEAQNFLRTAGMQALPNSGTFFYATPAQRADATMYLDSATQNVDFYSKNGLKPPTPAELQVAAARDAQIRTELKNATNAAAVAAATITLAGMPPALLNWSLAHPLEAITAGIITAETAASITSGAVTPSTLAPALAAQGAKLAAAAEKAVGGQVAKGANGGVAENLVTFKSPNTSNVFATNSGEAVFWSGKTNGVGGADVAGCVATTCRGTTLEQLMANKGINLPAWNAANPTSVAAWQNASKSFAQGASGDINAVIGSTLRPGSVWEVVELPALKANPNVTSITTIDPATGVKTIIWKK